jgi:hypothetical protein
MAVKSKPLIEYLDQEPKWWESKLLDYQLRPAVAFLREAVHISDAMNQCRRRFQRRKNGSFNKDSQDSVYRLGAAAFSSMMSHFETYERSLFAGIVDATRFMPDFKIEECCKRLSNDSQLNLDLSRLFAFRGRSAPIGQLIADSLGSWHNPSRVNAHFRAIVPDFQFIGGAESEELIILWQLRHSIVHTGNWLTHADAQKVRTLVRVGDRPILLNDNFVEAVARRLHGIVGGSTKAVGTKVMGKVSGVPGNDEKALKDLFDVSSPRKSWLKTAV